MELGFSKKPNGFLTKTEAATSGPAGYGDSGAAPVRRAAAAAVVAARVRVRVAAGGLARARGVAHKAPRPAEFWPVTARSRLRFFSLGRKTKRNTKRTPKIPK